MGHSIGKKIDPVGFYTPIPEVALSESIKWRISSNRGRVFRPYDLRMMRYNSLKSLDFRPPKQIPIDDAFEGQKLSEKFISTINFIKLPNIPLPKHLKLSTGQFTESESPETVHMHVLCMSIAHMNYDEILECWRKASGDDTSTIQVNLIVPDYPVSYSDNCLPAG
jgi:hypothetical protein